MISKKSSIRDAVAISVLPEILKASNQLHNYYGGADNILESDCFFAYKIADTFIRVGHETEISNYNDTANTI